MVGMFGQKVSQGQANGPDVDLVVRGTELYASYETPDGFPAVYDEALGLFCYARVSSGRFATTGIPITAPPPAGVERHVTESDAVRLQKINERMLLKDRNSQTTPPKER